MNPDRSDLRIAEEAADWLLKLEAQADTDCRSAFVAWLKHSPRHVDEFLLMTATLRVAREGGRASRIDAEALIREASTNIVPLQPDGASQLSGERVTVRGFLPLAAAAIALAIGLGLLLFHLAAPDTYVTPVGEQRIFKLADGSVIYLNTDSRVSVDFSRDLRDVHLLAGEALFAVAQEAARPFRVLTGTVVVQAVGTQFNVYRRDDLTTVSVVEGRVKVAHQGRSEALGIGEQAMVTEDGRILRQAAANIASAVAWRQRRLIFQSDTLEDIAREFNRYNSAQIHVEGDAAGQRRFTAVFNADEPQALLAFLRADPALDIQPTRDGTIIRSR